MHLGPLRGPRGPGQSPADELPRMTRGAKPHEGTMTERVKAGDVVVEGPWAGATVVSVYTRAQALEDGELVDAGELAREAGFRLPVALTRAAWATFVEVPKGCEGLQDEKGRLWDVLHMASFAIRGAKPGQTEVWVHVSVVTGVNAKGRPRRPEIRHLKAVCGPGDDAEPVITMMLPEED